MLFKREKYLKRIRLEKWLIPIWDRELLMRNNIIIIYRCYRIK